MEMSKIVLISLYIILIIFLTEFSAAIQVSEQFNIIKWDYDTGETYNDLIIRIDLSQSSPLSKISFNTFKPEVVFVPIKDFSYNHAVVQYDEVNGTLYNPRPNLIPLLNSDKYKTIPPLINSEQDICGGSYILGSNVKSYNEYENEILNKGWPYLDVYGCILKNNLLNQSRFETELNRLSEYKDLDSFLFPFSEGEIKFLMANPFDTSIAEITIIKPKYPKQWVTYKPSVSEIYFNEVNPINVNQDAFLITTKSPLNSKLSKMSVLNIQLKYYVNKFFLSMFLIVYVFLHFIFTSHIRENSKLINKRLGIFISVELGIIGFFHAIIYPQFLLSTISITLLDVFWLIIGVLFYFFLAAGRTIFPR